MTQYSRPTCPRCERRPVTPGRKFCGGCENAVLRQMQQDRYLDERYKLWTRNERKHKVYRDRMYNSSPEAATLSQALALKERIQSEYD